MNGIRFLPDPAPPALDAVLSEWRQRYPGLGVMALVPEADRDRVPLLQDLCRGRGIPLTGAVFPALVAGGRFHPRGCLLLRFDEAPFASLHAPFSPDDPGFPQSLELLAEEVRSRIAPPEESTLFLVFDQMVVNIQTILENLYLKLADGVRYLGVNAGSETFTPMPCLFDGERVREKGVLAVLLRGHPGGIVEHCYRAPQRMIFATSTEGSRIISIDWRPAFDVYREMAASEYGIAVDRENFYSMGVHFPFGIIRAAGDILVRIPVALQDDGSLFCVGEVPPNALLTLLSAPEVDSARTVETVAAGLRELCGDLGGRDLLAFYCAGRRLHLQERAGWELDRLAFETGATVAGALSLGEVGSPERDGCPFFHNGALAVCRWGRDEP